jgi:glycosyltransferase involved in cell wall biosynthesis
MALGGIQRKVIDVITASQNFYPKAEIIVCLRHKKGIFLKDIPENIKVYGPLFHTPKLDMLWFTVWLTFQILFHRPNIILSFMDLGSIPSLAALNILFWKKIKVIIGEDILTSKYVYTETRPKLRLKLIKKYYPAAKKILVQTKIQEKDLVSLCSKLKPKIFVSPNWLPLNFPPQSKTEFTDRKTDILFIGRIESQKNLPKLIQIVKLLSSTNPNLSIKIIGFGSKLAKIKKLVKQQKLTKNISFLPQTSYPQKYYLDSKIFLLTSDYEGFPLTLLEAISCGCYPVVNNIPEVSNFFDKYTDKIIFENTDHAVEIIGDCLKNSPNSKILNYYQQKILKNQQKDITQYLNNIYK